MTGCVVYSFGGSINTQFEIDLSRRTSCEVHTFDPICKETCPYGACYPQGTQCHEIALCASTVPCYGNGSSPRTKTLPTIMHGLGHTKLDVLKCAPPAAPLPDIHPCP